MAIFERGKSSEFKPSEQMEEIIEKYGKKDGRDLDRMRQAVRMSSTLEISWIKAFSMVVNDE